MAPRNKKSSFGPGFLVTAAFIGPGTVTTCSLAGAKFGYSLIYVLLFATLTTIILQEMAGRLSLSTGLDFAEALRTYPQNQLIKLIFIILILSSITFGCAAYEAGNIVGGALGMEMVSSIPRKFWVLLISCSAILVLSKRQYKLVEKILISLVFLMSISFLATLILIKPDISHIFKGLLPSLPKNSFSIILALVGTTVVPYNLFLHSAAVKEKWHKKRYLKDVRKDLFISIGIGGLISASIIVTSAVAFYEKGILLEKGAQMAFQMKPLLGSFTNFLFGLGFFAAGMSSAITAPYAAAFASSGILGWKGGQGGKEFRAVWLCVIFTGLIVSLFDLSPIAVIIFAQMANGFILPIASISLLWMLNNHQKMGNMTNSLKQNILGGIVILIVTLLGGWNVAKFFFQ
ncbi:MAG: Nramp family divalent metal transporter [Candidatus Aminicenantes bacterium]|nr:Nramp family divalent metal transporter [Candidatus Aminicenantes bacterium]